MGPTVTVPAFGAGWVLATPLLNPALNLPLYFTLLEVPVSGYRVRPANPRDFKS